MYDFDEIISRSNTHSSSEDGFKYSLFGDKVNEPLPYADDELIRMWVADMGFATPDFVRDAVKDRLDRKVMGYTDWMLTDEYFEVVKGWCKRRYDLDVKKEELFVSAGVVPALKSLVGMVGEKGDNVLILTPSYAPFKAAADYNGLNAVYSRLVEKDNCYTIDFEDLQKKAEDENTHILIFCNPHNPTGRVWTADELEKVGKICADNDMWIISDEIHCDLLRCGKTHIPFMNVMPEYKKLVTCMAPSKTFNMAGFMTSNILIRDEELKNKWKRTYSSNINPMSLAGATAAFSKGDEWLEALKAYLDKNFALAGKIFEEEAPKVKFEIPDATYLAWADLSEYIPVETEANVPFVFAENGGVVIEYGKMFVDNGLGHVRINLAYPASVVAEGIRRVCKVLNMIEKGEIKL